MSRCEICGQESELKNTKVEGTVLEVCDKCQELGMVTEDEEEDSQQSAKYSTESKSTESNNRNEGRPSQGKESSYGREPSFDEVSNLAMNYGKKIREERTKRGESREELSQKLGIKESHLQNIESENTRPSISLQEKIESQLGIDLSLDDELLS